jgi:outer membrane receptor for ferrienterochelin and colicin
MRRSHTHLGFAMAALLCAVALMVLPTSALAQTDVTTARIGGQVTDESGAPLPGATVECKNSETGLTVVETADQNGSYRCLNLPTGEYSVSATLEGFANAAADVRLVIGSAPTVNFTLPQGKVEETITVTADQIPTVEVTNTAAQTSIVTEQLKGLPNPGRDFRSLVLLTPQTRFDSERGNLSISGQRGINTNVTVDGVDFNNAFFGGTTGGAEGRAPLSISQESIKEFSVITNGASAEFGRSGGGVVNVVTKSGSNVLHGSLFYNEQPQSLIENFANGSEPRDQSKKQYGGSLGGPIVKDKLFYFVSYDQQKQSVTIPLVSTVLNSAVFAKYPELNTPPDYIQTRDGDVTFGRLDFQAAQQHRFWLRVNLTDYTGENGTSSATNRAESRNGVEGLDTKAYVGGWSGTFGSNLLNDLNLNYINEDTPREDKGLNLPSFQINSPSVSYGEETFLPITSTTKRKAIGDTLTYLRGDHVAKAGFEYNDTSINQVFKGNWRGVIIFNTMESFLAGKWQEYRQFGGLGGLTSDEAGKASFGQKETALFLQDQWFVTPKLTLSLGLRAENLDNPGDPILNPQDVNANGSFNLTAKVPDASLSDQLSPRLGISWSPDDKTAIRFSAGRFWSRTPAILLAQLYTSNGLRGTQFNIVNPVVNGVVTAPTNPLAPGWGTTFTVTGVERIDFTRVTAPPRPGVFAIDPNFENPYTDRLTLGAERELFWQTVFGLDLTYAKSKQLQRLKDLNRVYDGTTSANGLPHYSSTRPNPYYGTITTSVSDAESKYTAATLVVRRRLINNFSFYGALTYSKDKDNDSNERNFAGIQAEDYNDLDSVWGYSNRDQRWKGVVNALYKTPWWGIGVSGSLRYFSGSPGNPTAGVDINNDGQNGTDRPTVNGVHFERNSFRQPSFRSLDLRLSKDFNVGPGAITVFADCFNCTNEDNFSITDFTYGNNADGTPRTTFLTKNTGGDPRTIQFGARFDF